VQEIQVTSNPIGRLFGTNRQKVRSARTVQRPTGAGSSCGAANSSGAATPLWLAVLPPCLSLVCLLAVGSFAGCTSLGEYIHNGFQVGPDYRKPAALVADEWIDSTDSRLEQTLPNYRQWWSVFDDPVLDRLIEIAYKQSITLREAGIRVAQSQELRAIAVGNFFPQTQELFGDYAQTQRSTKTASFRRSSSQIDSGNVGLREFGNWRFGAALAWEVDFWGRYRRLIEAADARLDGAVENFDDALVLLIAEVATAYVDVRTYDQRIAFAQGNADMQRESTRIAEARRAVAAIDSEIDAPQAKSNLARTLAAIEALVISRRQTQNRLCVLLGMPPHDLDYLLEGTKPVPAAPQSVAVGVPAELLRRRPDVRRAERLAAAACAEIGVAESSLYPRIAFNGTMGFEAAQPADLFDGGAWTGTVGPSFRWNFLNYGRLLHAVRLQDDRFQEQVAIYQQTVLRANEEAENAMVAFLNYHDQIKLISESVREAEEAVRVTQAKYRAGRIDFNRVFTVEQLLLTIQDQLAQAEGNHANSLIGLYRALGGGWEIRLEQASEE
jgi:NodT family efflux transporter outer membrane factor (OMF) lipoprotein